MEYSESCHIHKNKNPPTQSHLKSSWKIHLDQTGLTMQELRSRKDIPGQYLSPHFPMIPSSP